MDHNTIPIDLTKSMFMVFWTFVVIISFCELGETVCNQFNSFHAKLIECNWYLYPTEMQRMFAILMSDAQQQTNIHGIGYILCARSTVKQVEKRFFLVLQIWNGRSGVFVSIIMFNFCSHFGRLYGRAIVIL